MNLQAFLRMIFMGFVVMSFAIGVCAVLPVWVAAPITMLCSWRLGKITSHWIFEPVDAEKIKQLKDLNNG